MWMSPFERTVASAAMCRPIRSRRAASSSVGIELVLRPCLVARPSRVSLKRATDPRPQCPQNGSRVNGSNPLADAANRILHAMYVERAGAHGPLVLLVHGSIVPGWRTWSAQRPLAERYQLVVPHRTGYPPNPPLARIDFEVQAAEIAELIQPGTHVVGHSYGGVVALLAAALVPGRVRSLAVIEPPAFGVARGTPAVEELITHLTPVYADSGLSAREFFAQFAAAVGATTTLPDPLPPEIEAPVQATRVERFPWEAQLPLDQ